jgi:hypothetical protein
LPADTLIEKPVVLNGCIRTAGEVDRWRINSTPRQKIRFDLVAASLGSKLDAGIRVVDDARKQILEAGSTASRFVEPQGTFIVPGSGHCVVELWHVSENPGGHEYAYRLQLGPELLPDFRLSLPGDALTLFLGAETTLTIPVERISGFGRAIQLTLDGLPEGITATDTTVANDQNEGKIKLTATNDARVDGHSATYYRVRSCNR